MELKPGSRWRSVVSSTEVVVVRPPKAEGELTCGGHPMVKQGEPLPDGLLLVGEGSSQIGKRYVDEASGLETLCAKGGEGAVSFAGRPLVIRDSKKLPASD